MRKVSILIIFFGIIGAILLSSCDIENNIVPKYSKEEECDYSYSSNNNILTINSTVSDIKVIRGDTSEIKINMKKIVRGDYEEKLQESLDSIQCTFKDNVINIESESNDHSIARSKQITTVISVPKNILLLNITSNVGDIDLKGDYDDIEINKQTGELSYEGELKQCNIYSDVGAVKLNLHRLDPSYNYKINGNVGQVTIKIPQGDSINLMGEVTKDIDIAKEIKLADNSAKFDISTKVSNVKICSTSK